MAMTGVQSSGSVWSSMCITICDGGVVVAISTLLLAASCGEACTVTDVQSCGSVMSAVSITIRDISTVVGGGAGVASCDDGGTVTAVQSRGSVMSAVSITIRDGSSMVGGGAGVARVARAGVCVATSLAAWRAAVAVRSTVLLATICGEGEDEGMRRRVAAG